MDNDRPRVSIVVEWENVLRSKQRRCIKMLNQVGLQALSLAHSTEVLVLYNPEQVDADTIDSVLERQVKCFKNPAMNVHLAAAVGKHYYDLKNYGAELARAEVVVFVDSDAVPESGWLRELVHPFFENPDVQVVAGHTFVDPENLYARAFAVGWFFPLPPEERQLHNKGRRFFANNVAFRTGLLRKHPFPTMNNKTRGACAALASHLRSEGISIWVNTAAQATHPPPNGLAHFLVRGLAEGRDRVFTWHDRGASLPECSLNIVRFGYRKLRKTALGCARKGSTVGLTRAQAPAVFTIMLVYYTLTILGGWATCILPGRMSRGLRI